MPSKETQDLLDQLKGLTGAAEAASASESPGFEDAVNKLDQLAGGRRSTWKASAFEDAVWSVLSSIDGAVVARQPHTTGSRFEPDFLVSVDDRKVLIEAKAHRSGGQTLWRSLVGALRDFRADEAVIVVPDGTQVPLTPHDDRVKVLEMHDLRDFFLR